MSNQNTLILIKLLFVLFYSLCALGYNEEKCMKEVLGGNMLSGIISATQYTSSWGACSALAKDMFEEREEFIEANIDSIRAEAAKGGGENINSLSYLSGCNKNVSSVFSTFCSRESDFSGLESNE